MKLDKDIWESFKIARDNLYPLEDIPQNWVSVYSASLKILESKLSKFQISQLAKKGIIRSNEEKKVYIKDVELVRTLFFAFDTFRKENLIDETKDHQGRDVLVVMPVESKKSGKTLFESQVEAVGAILKDAFMKEWSKQQIDK